MKNIIKKIFRWFYNRYFLEKSEIRYKHGKCFYSNSQIDTLSPQFVEIGDNFISAPGSLITAHDASTFLFTKKYRIEKVIIGDNVFLGANSVVLPGVTIGNKVIVGAGAIVTKNIPSNSVCAGNPAKVICTVDEYISKCIFRNVLYEVPLEFLKEFEMSKKLSKSSINSFQEKTVKDYNDRNELSN